MHLTHHIRRTVRKRLIGTADLALTGTVPDVGSALRGTDALGLYLHLPFCRHICPYCPYNKTAYHPKLADAYADAVLREIDLYAPLVGERSVTSLYVGGGTPTVMLDHGLDRILDRIANSFRLRSSVHMESHPSDLTEATVGALVEMGVAHLSIGVEALQDRHLRSLGRPYTAKQARTSIRRAVTNGFECVNADMMFALPDQRTDEAVETARILVDLGVDQVAAYPLFDFPYTPWARGHRSRPTGPSAVFRRRRMLRALERVFYDAGFTRTSVWAFTRPGVPAYCSVTVPLYVGLGASGGSYLHDVFYLNTFDTRAYVETLEQGRLPVALSVPLSLRMQMAGWLYWRLYGVHISKHAFKQRFNRSFDSVYGRVMRVLGDLRLVRDDGADIVLTDAGAYWLHVFQDFFSLDAVGKLWSAAQAERWPRRVVL